MYLPDTVRLYDEIYTRMKNYGEEAEKIAAALDAAHCARTEERA